MTRNSTATSGSEATRVHEVSLLSRSNVKSLGLSLLVLGCAAACAAAATGKFDPCSLLTRGEIEEVQGDRVVSTKASEPERDRFAVSQCFYSLATFSKSISLEVTRRRPQAAESPRTGWKQMFARALDRAKEREEEAESEGKGGREKGRRAAARPLGVSGVGDEAFWDGSSLSGGLFVLKGDSYFRLSVGGPENETVKIEKLKKLARRALARLP